MDETLGALAGGVVHIGLANAVLLVEHS